MVGGAPTRWCRVARWCAARTLAVISPIAFAAATVSAWSPVRVSSQQFESHAAFDPVSGDLYFVRSSPQFRGWRILTSRCGRDGWTEPAAPAIAGDGVEADPWFTRDGRRLYFISTRTTDGVSRNDLDIWQVDRGEDGMWHTPVRLPAPVNSTGHEWFPRIAADGWLYFGSDRAGGHGKTDIWRAREREPGRWEVENAGAAINSSGDEFEAEISPDGSRMILMADDGYYESTLAPTGWAPRRRMGSEINRNGTEVGALFSPSGHSLLFSRDTKGPLSGEFLVWRWGSDVGWPPACPGLKHRDE